MRIKLFLSVIFFVVLFVDSSALEKKRIMIASVDYSKALLQLSPYKFEAALDITCRLTDKYTLISSKHRDSLTAMFNKAGKSPSAIEVADSLKADLIIFSKLNLVGNMLRVDLSMVENNSEQKRHKAFGYGAVSIRNSEDNTMIYDPAILAATQRAFAAIMGDSLMFDKMDDITKVYPTKTLIIGGLFYINDKSSKDWDLFANKELSSYDACESIFRASLPSKKYIVYDIETRDTIYSLFGLKTVENFNPVSAYELKALSHFEVESFISGVFKKVADGVEIELILYDIIKGNLVQLKSEKGMLRNDSIIEYRKVLSELTSKLLEL